MQRAEAAESSGEEWLPNFEDVVDSSDEEGGDFVAPRRPVTQDFENWCQSTSSFKPMRLDMEQLQGFYRPKS